MERMSLRIPALAIMLAGTLAAAPAMAAKPDDKGGGNPHKSEQSGKKGGGSEHGKSGGSKGGSDHAKGHDSAKGGAKVGLKFDDRQRDVLRNYFQTEFKRGSCPPGLAKKRNGCMPPGQAKKWQVGHRLPPDVIYHDLPDWVLRDLGQPPAGHRYVRVDGDVLLLAIGTSLVVDALSDLF